MDRRRATRARPRTGTAGAALRDASRAAAAPGSRRTVGTHDVVAGEVRRFEPSQGHASGVARRRRSTLPSSEVAFATGHARSSPPVEQLPNRVGRASAHCRVSSGVSGGNRTRNSRYTIGALPLSYCAPVGSGSSEAERTRARHVAYCWCRCVRHRSRPTGDRKCRSVKWCVSLHAGAAIAHASNGV